MKSPTNKLSALSNTKRIFTALRTRILAVLIGCLTFGAQATVQVTRFDPPLNISAYADAPANSFFNVLGVDFDSNGEVDFRLAYGLGGISAFLNSPVCFGQRVSGPGVAGRGGPVAGVPLGSFIGTNIVSFAATNFYAWSPGGTNRDDLTQPLGDHESTVIIANLVTYNVPLSGISTGILVTNIPFPTVPIVSGDVVGRESVIAVQFYVSGEVHYGYIHCDFRDGAAGVIYGWAYETLPNVPIEAAPLSPVPAQAKGPTGIVGFVNAGVLQGWTVGVSTAHGDFVKSVRTDKDGSFKMNLKPGLYTVTSSYVPHPGPGQPLPNYVLMGTSKSVIVTKNRFTFVELGTSLGLVVNKR